MSSWSYTRGRRSASRRHSSRDRPRYQHVVRADAAGTQPGSVRLGCRPTTGVTLHHQPQPSRAALWRRPAAERTSQGDSGGSSHAYGQEDLAGRILPFDGAGAVHYAKLVMARRDAGAPIEAFDALIAATMLAAGVRIATHDVGGFASGVMTFQQLGGFANGRALAYQFPDEGNHRRSGAD